MNARSSKVLRLSGWCAICVTVVAVAAGAYLAMTFLQEGETLRGSIAGGISAAVAVIGGMLSYLCFFVASMAGGAPVSVVVEAPAQADTPVQAATADVAEEAHVDEELGQVVAEVVTESESSDSLVATDLTAEVISPAVTAVTTGSKLWAAPESSDDEIPVYTPATIDDDSLADMLVVPPPATRPSLELPSGDLPAPFRVEEEFDSRFDLPVTIDPSSSSDALEPESSDAFGSPLTAATTPSMSSMTPTQEFSVVSGDESLTLESSKPIIMDAADSTVTLLPTGTPAVVEPAPAVVPPAAKGASKKQQRSAAEERPAPIAAEKKPVPKPVAAPVDEPLPTASELPSMATTLTPTIAGGGLMPSEIPDFFLRMPTGRPLPTAKPAMPVAPLAVKAPAPAPAHPAAQSVRIIDSSTPKNVEEDLMTMTSIPDDWPS